MVGGCNMFLSDSKSCSLGNSCGSKCCVLFIWDLKDRMP